MVEMVGEPIPSGLRNISQPNRGLRHVRTNQQLAGAGHTVIR